MLNESLLARRVAQKAGTQFFARRSNFNFGVSLSIMTASGSHNGAPQVENPMSRLREYEPWTKEQFFAWQQGEDDRYELVGGFPMKMMTGASRRHDRIVIKIIAALERRLAGSPCESFTADGSVETYPGQIRRPDVGIDCGPTGPDDFKAKSPTVVFEVLSPTTRDFDRIRKLEEYKHVPTLRHIVIVEPKFVGVIHVARASAEAAWQTEITNDMDHVLALTGAGIELPLAEIYAGVELSEPPKT